MKYLIDLPDLFFSVDWEWEVLKVNESLTKKNVLFVVISKRHAEDEGDLISLMDCFLSTYLVNIIPGDML